MAGLFGGLFDFNHDGKMSIFERAVEYSVFEEMTRAEDNDLELDEWGYAGSNDAREELEAAGLDIDELEYMDSDERREALEDAGLDFVDHYNKTHRGEYLKKR